MSADDAAFLALSHKISLASGLTLGAYKDKCLRRRIAVRMRAVGALSYADYVRVLDETPGEVERLMDALTINVTKFYRNPETWNLLAEKVLPELWARTRGERLKVWSAGCASGEEPYTLAMLFAEEAARRGEPHRLERVSIDATDIDRVCLDRARLARYPSTAFSETPAALVTTYCRAEGTELRVIDRIRERVRVSRLDLTQEAPPAPPYDVIVCRNVVIYFDRPTQERLFEAFERALVPGGFLVLGKVETLFGPARDRLDLVDVRERIYRRPA